MPCFEHVAKWRTFEERSNLAHNVLASRHAHSQLVLKFDLKEVSIRVERLSQAEITKLTASQNSKRICEREQHVVLQPQVLDSQSQSEGKHTIPLSN
jgi:hypothetical protein